MHSITRFAAAAAAFATLLSVASFRTTGAEESDGDVVTKQVQVRDITLTLPDSWRQTQPASTLRLAQFAVPPVMGDKETTELAVFSFAGGGGGVDDNIRRWINQFEPQGREVKLTKGQSPQGEYWFADIQGTYLMPVGPPIRQQTKRLEGGRMLGMILKAEKGVYFLRMAGPRYTVSAQENAMRQAVGAAQGEETEYELAENGAEP